MLGLGPNNLRPCEYGPSPCPAAKCPGATEFTGLQLMAKTSYGCCGGHVAEHMIPVGEHIRGRGVSTNE